MQYRSTLIHTLQGSSMRGKVAKFLRWKARQVVKVHGKPELYRQVYQDLKKRFKKLSKG